MDEWAHSVCLVRGVEKHAGFPLRARVCVRCMAVLNVINVWAAGSEGGGHPPVPATHSSTTKTLIQPPATSVVSNNTWLWSHTHMHSCVYTYGVTSWQKPRGVPQGSVLFPFSFSPSSPSLISLYFSLTRCPRTNRWSKVMSPAHQLCRPAWWQTSPLGAPLTKQQPPYNAGSTWAISLNVTQHWLRARPTIQQH